MFELLQTDGRARRGRFTCAHGTVETPVFMNVGTQAAIKGGLAAEDLEQIGCQVELSNTYHLHLRPGEDIVRSLGGLHGFMNWSRPILTGRQRRNGGNGCNSRANVVSYRKWRACAGQNKMKQNEMN